MFFDQSLQSLISVSRIRVESRHRIVAGKLIHVSQLWIVIDEEMHGGLGRPDEFGIVAARPRSEPGILEKSRRADMEDGSGRHFGNEAVAPGPVDGTFEDREQIPAGPEERTVRVDRPIDPVETISDGQSQRLDLQSRGEWTDIVRSGFDDTKIERILCGTDRCEDAENECRADAHEFILAESDPSVILVREQSPVDQVDAIGIDDLFTVKGLQQQSVDGVEALHMSLQAMPFMIEHDRGTCDQIEVTKDPREFVLSEIQDLVEREDQSPLDLEPSDFDPMIRER